MKHLWLSVLFGLIACGEETESSLTDTKSEAAESVNSIEREVTQGGLIVRTTITPDAVRLGDPFMLELVVEGRTDIEVEMPPFGEALGRLTIADFTPKQQVLEQSGETIQRHSQRYGLQPNRSGEVVIPALRVGYRETQSETWEEILTEPIPVIVQSILPTDGDLAYQKARARLAPLPVQQPWMLWAGVGASVIGCGVAGWFFSRRKITVDQISAYEASQRRLKQLSERFAMDSDAVDELYTELSLILRAYLEDAVHLSALEQTTQELKRSFESQETAVSKEQAIPILEILSLCDGVKFAGKSRTTEEWISDVEVVRTLIDALHHQLSIRTTGEVNDGLV